MTSAAVAHALRSDEEVSDEAIDFWLGEPYRRASRRFWTPVSVARTAARWLAEAGATSVLDVGAGVGKFCVVSALASDLFVTGIEQRLHLVVEGSKLARRFRVEGRCRLLAGTIVAGGLAERARTGVLAPGMDGSGRPVSRRTNACVDLAAFDALYVFNSFAENVYPRDQQLDDTVELSARRLRDDLRTLEDGLARMVIGGAFVTYHGFGGQIPDTFDLVRDEPAGSGELRLWVKRRRRSQGGCWVEVADGVAHVDEAPR